MSAPISRRRAAAAILAFALICTAWTSIQVRNASALPATDGAAPVGAPVCDVPSLCTATPAASCDPGTICGNAVSTALGAVATAEGTANGAVATATNLATQAENTALGAAGTAKGEVDNAEAWAGENLANAKACPGNVLAATPDTLCGDAYGQVAGTVNGEVNDDKNAALGDVAGVQQGSGPAGPAPVGDATGSYEDATGQAFVNSTPCAATRNSALGDASSPCDKNNKYACWERYIGLERQYIRNKVYWQWQSHLSWCGWTMGKITSHSYNDHDAISVGLNCALTDEKRIPLEKIDGGHWQEHSNFVFKCEWQGISRESHATEGWHFYNNGYYENIERGGDEF